MFEQHGEAPRDRARPSSDSRRGGSNPEGTSRFVLIVDDDPDLLDVTSFVIENGGMVVETDALLRVVERYGRGDHDAGV